MISARPVAMKTGPVPRELLEATATARLIGSRDTSLWVCNSWCATMPATSAAPQKAHFTEWGIIAEPS
jgi:hypothetical protein